MHRDLQLPNSRGEHVGMTESVSLAQRLRAETAPLHRRTEELAGVPGRVTTIADYVELLNCMLAFHLAAERSMGEARWSVEWARLGVVIHDHSRSGLIVRDLGTLGAEPDELPSPPLGLSSFPEALGCLYVVEGSSLGGRFIGPAISEQLGAVPTAYYDGADRGHPAPWRSVQAALGRYESDAADADGVVAGAVATFTFFGGLIRSRGMLHESV